MEEENGSSTSQECNADEEVAAGEKQEMVTDTETS